MDAKGPQHTLTDTTAKKRGVGLLYLAPFVGNPAPAAASWFGLLEVDSATAAGRAGSRSPTVVENGSPTTGYPGR